ncbi:protein-export membrane protein SecD [Neorickettsia helminthoeca str. Oregon]|uniref:Protein translocase subunit SecD n=1 Tax=Neorickettsia helminthoeca str. Oregon TaxID=1286528 RepID=X5H4E2_9RICK|nr:protein translocase subunit SecD [Neorickettsia helminthoeca]AHX11538.1 protein-export membrane protein SecD [Neorickettsia helminthoeca str. Oregon]
MSARVKLFFLFCLVGLGLFVVWGNFSSRTGRKISMGLDLRGGVSITMSMDQAEYLQEKLRRVASDVSEFAKESNVKILRIKVDEVQPMLSISLAEWDEHILTELKKFFKHSSEIVLDKIDRKNAVIQLVYSEQYLREINRQLIEDSISNLRRRVDEFGVRETLIYSLGTDRIVIEVPGLKDPEELISILGKTAKLAFHMVLPDKAILLGRLTLEDKLGRRFTLERHPSLTGDLLDEASVAFSQKGTPVVRFKFNSYGTKKLEQISKANIGRPMAIVLDDTVLTAPVIRDPIIGGRGEISGNFDTKEAKELALLLKSGSLPARLNVIEQRVIGPSLGAKSTSLAKKSGILAVVLVILFMLFAYRIYGLIAAIALIMNLILLLAGLTLIEATLTLPGIAGLILTIGMAVDANVLIFERIREEFAKTGVLSNSIMKGFEHAKATIFDSNITTLAAALIMIIIGSGPIKGFAVTLSLGIITSIFSSVFATKVMMEAFIIRSRQRV